jgi:hypothetical protein
VCCHRGGGTFPFKLRLDCCDSLQRGYCHSYGGRIIHDGPHYLGTRAPFLSQCTEEPIQVGFKPHTKQVFTASIISNIWFPENRMNSVSRGSRLAGETGSSSSRNNPYSSPFYRTENSGFGFNLVTAREGNQITQRAPPPGAAPSRLACEFPALIYRVALICLLFQFNTRQRQQHTARMYPHQEGELVSLLKV